MSKHTKIAKTQGNQVDSEPTLHDLICAVNAGFSDMEARFSSIDDRFIGIDSRLSRIDSRFTGIDDRFISIDDRFSRIESKMVTKDDLKEALAKMETRLVTKDYLDDKINDLRGDLTVSLRKEDQKVVTLVSVLQARKVLSKKDAQRVMAMELFPRQI